MLVVSAPVADWQLIESQKWVVLSLNQRIFGLGMEKLT